MVGKNSNKTNAKEMFYLQVVVARIPNNSAPFMIAHMHVVQTASNGSISFGGVITSIARALGLDTELATLDPLPPCSLDLRTYISMIFIRAKKNRKFLLMVHNISIYGIILPFPDHTDVHNEAN